MTYLGYLVAAMGIVLVACGTFGGARSVLAESGKGFAGASDTVAAVLKEIPALIDSLGRAPKWLAAIIVGVFLVWIGSRMAVRLTASGALPEAGSAAIAHSTNDVERPYLQEDSWVSSARPLCRRREPGDFRNSVQAASLTEAAAPLLAAGLFFAFTSKMLPLTFTGAPFALAAGCAVLGVSACAEAMTAGRLASSPDACLL